MAEYSIQFVASAAREFRALPTDMKRKVGSSVEAISKNPWPTGVRKLHGHERLYRIRVGYYRVIYEIDDQSRIILITRIRHRREAYR